MKKFNVKMLAILGALTAVSVILTRLLSIYLASSIRISFGNIPIILAGPYFGPIAGALCGAAADILGAALLSPLGWYPPLTISATLMGLIPGLLRRFPGTPPKLFRTAGTILSANMVASMGLSTFILSGMYGTSFLSLLTIRAPLYVGITIVETAAVYLILRRVKAPSAALRTDRR